jgi:hypothetical protein
VGSARAVAATTTIETVEILLNMKIQNLYVLCGALSLAALAPLALAAIPQEKVGALSPDTVRSIVRTLQPQLDPAPARKLRPRPEAADLKVYPMQVERVAAAEGRLRFRIFVPISNIGRASSVGVVAKLMGIDAATGRERLCTSARIPALRMDEMQGVGNVVGIEAKASVVSQRYSKLWIVLEPSDRRHTTTYSDADNTNNTVELSGDELVRKLGL